MHIPMAYMPDATHRLQQYQKLAAADSIEEVQQLSGDWESSYGELPPETLNLCWMHEIRILCIVYGFERIDWHKEKVILTSHAKTVFLQTHSKKSVKNTPKDSVFVLETSILWKPFLRKENPNSHSFFYDGFFKFYHLHCNFHNMMAITDMSLSSNTKYIRILGNLLHHDKKYIHSH